MVDGVFVETEREAGTLSAFWIAFFSITANLLYLGQVAELDFCDSSLENEYKGGWDGVAAGFYPLSMFTWVILPRVRLHATPAATNTPICDG